MGINRNTEGVTFDRGLLKYICGMHSAKMHKNCGMHSAKSYPMRQSDEVHNGCPGASFTYLL